MLDLAIEYGATARRCGLAWRWLVSTAHWPGCEQNDDARRQQLERSHSITCGRCDDAGWCYPVLFRHHYIRSLDNGDRFVPSRQSQIFNSFIGD